MKKILVSCAILIMLVFCATADTATGLHGESTFGDFEYVKENGTVKIIGFTGKGTSCEVPEKIENLPVTVIGPNAFTIWYMALTDITLPASITRIEKDGFYNCITLERVNIPEKVTYIGDHTFCKCLNMPSIKLPDSLTEIGEGAFYFCEALKEITIPKNLITIGVGAFYGCKSLKKIKVAFGNPVYKSVSDVLFTKDGKTLVTYPAGKAGKYSIPKKTTAIATGAFYGSELITSITIPKSITEIPEQAFARCKALQSVTIPNSVTSIGQSAFLKCTALKTIKIPDSVETIGAYAFSECSSLNNVVIPPSVKKISNNAFYYCIKLTNIEIPDSVTEFGDNVFPADKVTVTCSKNSAAYKYCQDNNVKVNVK